MKIFNHSSEKGFSALFIAFLSLAIIFSIVAGLSVLTLEQTRVAGNIVQSVQSYYASEGGIEDMLLRLKDNLNWSTPYNLNISNGVTTIEVSNVVGGARTITSTGNNLSRIRKVSAVYSLATDQVAFHYGAQIGEGGIQIQNTAKIKGNVFSNSSIIGTNKQEITGTAIVAGNGNKIEDLKIGGDAMAHTCQDSEIGGELTYVSGGSIAGCTAGGSIKQQPNQIELKDLPIFQSQIDGWKTEALSGGVNSGDLTFSSGQTSLGPKKIMGNLTVQGTAKVLVGGTIWVTGDLILKNTSQTTLDPVIYGLNSGLIIVDGQITISNSAQAKGSGSAGSYLVLLSNFDSTQSGQNAIVSQNSPEVDIIYASKGFILVQNSMELREVSGWGLKLQNSAEVEYEIGLQDVSFSSGPGASWKVVNWQEVE